MHIKLLVLFALVSVVRNHDVSIGSDGGRRIFEDTRFASPAIWRQVENVTVIAPENEVISKVNITDMRADKDGDVDIVDGGAGEKSVTVEIKSPTVLRGYEFHIEVFSVPESNYKTFENANTSRDLPEDVLNYEYKTTTISQNSDSENSETNKDIPSSIAKDSDVLRPSRQTDDVSDIPQMPEESETKISSTEILYEESTTTENDLSTINTQENNDETTESVEGSGSDEDSASVIPSDWLRPARDLTEIPIENEVTMTTTEISNDDTTVEDISTPDNSDNKDSTTEALEVVPVDSNARPARETSNENESTVTTTETVNMETTEGSIMENAGDNTMSTPDTYVSTKNMPDYSALSILDYIKNKEQGSRQIRRIEEKDTSDTENSDEEQNNENEDSSSTTEVPNPTIESDDSVDLVPPEVDAPYNDNFTPDLGSTESSIESTSYENSRKARRYELPDEFYTTPLSEDPTTAAASEDSTPMTEDATTESSLEEKSRNSRNTEDNLENSNNFNLTSEAEHSDESNVASNEKVSSSIVLLKGDKVIITADGKQVEFTLPIVLIIANENNFPIFNIAEEPIDMEKKDLDQSKIGLDIPEVTMDYEDRDAAINFARNDEYSY